MQACLHNFVGHGPKMCPIMGLYSYQNYLLGKRTKPVKLTTVWDDVNCDVGTGGGAVVGGLGRTTKI